MRSDALARSKLAHGRDDGTARGPIADGKIWRKGGCGDDWWQARWLVTGEGDLSCESVRLFLWACLLLKAGAREASGCLPTTVVH